MQLILPVLLFVFLLSKNVAMEVESIDADVVTIESAPVIESAPEIETAPAPKHQPFNVDKAAILLEHMKMVSSEIFEEHVSIESIEELSTSAIPTAEPTSVPSSRPTGEPTVKPSSEPTSKPSSKPSATPTSRPTSEPTSVPSSAPTSRPTSAPSSIPSSIPTSAPSCQPSSQPTSVPSSQPSSVPSVQPSTVPSGQPTGEPTRPSFQPTFTPYAPSAFPTYQSTDVVTVSALYVLTTVNGAQLDSESEETITQTINELAPKPSTVNVKSISRIIARKLIGHGRRLATGFTYECDVDYSFNLINYPGYNAATLAAVKSSYIELIGTNGTFQSTLRQNAQENTATQLYSTTVASVDVESTIIPAPSFAPTKGPGKTRTARLTDGQIAGLVIGLVVGTGCLFGLLYYYVVAKRASTSYDYPGTNYQQSAGTVLQRGNFDDTVTINIEDRDVVTKAQTISL